MREKLWEIKEKLRLSMDGIRAASMKEKGIDYTLNWGVPVVTLRRIAKQYAPDPELAEALWKEDVREFKILATLLCPVENYRKADEWVEGIHNMELAEQFCMNLMPEVRNAGTYAERWVRSEKLFTQVCGFLLYGRLFMKGFQPGENQDGYYHAVLRALGKESPLLKNAVLTSLKRLGRQSVIQAKDILATYEIWYPTANDEQLAIYDDLKFEFDYYLA